MTGAFAGERALVVGFGQSGRAAARILIEEGASVRVSEERPPGEVGPTVPGTELLAGGHRREHLNGMTVVVVSPGVPEHAPIIRWAMDRGLPVWSELELGARLCRSPIVAVTGTNGKTTTVELVASMMRAAGLDSTACGNVGFPFSLAARKPFDALAVEASSFQLRFHQTFHPRVSVLLNLAPDHLDWHGSFRAYAEAKARIYSRQRPGDVHLGSRDDPESARVSRAAPCPVSWYGWGSGDQIAAGVVDGRVVIRTAEGAVAVGPALTGQRRSFLLDAAAAAGAATAFGIPVDAVAQALASFRPLPHRGSVVAEIGSVKFLDDSKATNPHAALAALDGLSGVVLIAGGLSKGVDLSPLSAATPSLTAVVAIGEAAPDVAAAFRGLVPVHMARSMEEAVEVAFGEAAPGGMVLLAPACASQDMFSDYRERGDRFAAAARALAKSRPAGGSGSSTPSGTAVAVPDTGGVDA